MMFWQVSGFQLRALIHAGVNNKLYQHRKGAFFNK